MHNMAVTGIEDGNPSTVATVNVDPNAKYIIL